MHCDDETDKARDAKCRRYCKAFYGLSGYCYEGPTSNFCICRERKDIVPNAL